MININILLNTDQLFQRLRTKFSDISPVLELIAGIIDRAIDRNFDKRGRWNGSETGLFAGGSNRWTPLAQSTLAGYKQLGYELKPTLLRQKRLKSTIEVSAEPTNSIRISANSPYARIHQEGGVIRHPGGTPYILTPFARFISLSKAKELESLGKKVRYTKAHNITMPPRPFIVLTEDDMRDINAVISKYITSS